ncbi:MAG: hypothetical protein H8E14_03155 [Candidatus Marinimicrobia bacterium]|nr:hypothetical protein [Candidatus Neomarinimicrobiota bacterium]MBL7113426.1 hypothetical protein [Bacteroidales bacterium]
MIQTIYRRAENFEPDFDQLLKVIAGNIPDRPTLFEFFTNNRLIEKLSNQSNHNTSLKLQPFRHIISSFTNAGYDYATISAWRTNTLSFPKSNLPQKASRSLNAGNMITDRHSFEQYPWPKPEHGEYELYYDLRNELPDGMKLIASGNGGLLENVIDLVGFENISLMYMLDEKLTTDIFNAVGSRLLRFYEIIAPIETIGACIVNDDWGFKVQTMFPPEMLQRWVFPWHKKMVATIHNAGKPAILHSCGQLKDVMNDIIGELRYDAKHSFEDEILPVEDAYDLWADRIAILGGIDMDFLARGTPEEIVKRSKKMLEKGLDNGGYALGSGNSIPEYIPDENYLAMISTVNMI